MGFSVAAAAAIIGVSIIMAMEIIVGTTIPTITDTHNSYYDMKNRAMDQVQTDINITSVSTPANGSNYDHNITVDNTGSIYLETEYFNILINGTSYPFNCSKSYLYPERDAYLKVDNLPGTGPRELKVITNNGVSDYYEYTVT